MSTSTISQLTAVLQSDLDDTVTLPVDDNDLHTRKATIAQLRQQIMAFPSAQVASNGANTLDDYEEGSWTPTVGGTATYSQNVGFYIKIGRLVWVCGDITIITIGTGSTTLISGLPFTPAAVTMPGSVGYFSGAANTLVFLSCYINPSATTLQLTALTSAGSTVGTPAVFANGTRLIFTACYLATS